MMLQARWVCCSGSKEQECQPFQAICNGCANCKIVIGAPGGQAYRSAGLIPPQPQLKVQFEIIKTLDTRTEHSTGCRNHSAERAEALADDSRGMVPRHERGHPLSLERVCFQGNH